MKSALLSCCVGLAVAGKQQLIVDTDMGFDVDDVVAVSVANSLKAQGKADILAIVHDTGCEKGVGGISAINHWYGHDDILIGAWKGEFGKGCANQDQYLSKVIESMPGPVTNYNQVMSGTDAYRKALANATDGSVNIASIGLPTNLRDLLQTKADQYSSLSGKDLVAAKVDTIVFMDGGYNFGCTAGLVDKDAKDCWGSAAGTLNDMPSNVKMIASLKGQNPDIYTGDQVESKHPAGSPIRKALENWCCSPNGKDGRDTGRLSWDPIAVMIAAAGVDAINMKETHPAGKWSADDNGKEHNIGGGTNNAFSDFQHGASTPGVIKSVINGYVDWLPNSPTPTPPPMPAGCKAHTTATNGAGPAMAGYGGGDYTMAWDGNTKTFYDYSQGNGGWTQSQLDKQSSVTSIRFYPREGFLDRNVNGHFAGVTSSGAEVTLATITTSPAVGWNTLNVSASDTIASVKYYSPDRGYGNIAEIEVYQPCTSMLV